MYVHATPDTPFAIDLDWWDRHGRNLRRFLWEILGEDEGDGEALGDEPLDYIDKQTGEVFQLDPLWTRVLVDKAHRPDYITTSTPLTNAVLRALIENRNEPMTVVQLQRRLNRSDPRTLLRLMKAARSQYGIVPVGES